MRKLLRQSGWGGGDRAAHGRILFYLTAKICSPRLTWR